MHPEPRIEYLVTPGEGIILTDSLIAYRDRVRAFIADTGISEEDLVLTPVVSIPLPVTSATDGVRNRPQINPDMAWFPLFWLPLSVGLRMRVQLEEGGELRPETDEEWAVRIISQAAGAGLFDPETGTWLDVLATVGLDSTSHAVHERVLAWQSGEPDPDLDRIDLTPLFNTSPGQVAESLRAAHKLTRTQWALSAGDIRVTVDAVLSMHLSDEDLRTAAESWTVLAAIGFSGDPVIESGGSVTDALRGLLMRLESGEMGPEDVIARLSRIAGAVYAEHEHLLSEQELTNL